ncbi:iron-sulfur cluster carrier protein ApbC [Oxalobacter sp. OttesenSCG-928-P03]|nr:iron-sulfur cluster carrier protein ApbC [Oxalobacter sp. OttesenSCG-928-P03]
MRITEESVKKALSGVVDVNTGKDLVSSEMIRKIRIDGASVQVFIELPYPAKSQWGSIEKQVVDALQEMPGIESVDVEIRSAIRTHAVQGMLRPMSNVKNIIAVASGKGGVGKSTVAVNLALALSAEGARVGILDADIHGPSQPMMLGLNEKPQSSDGQTFDPLEKYGVQIISIGLMIDPDEPVIWRAPVVTQALVQLLEKTNWHDLDYLIVDLPPGTGDIQLTLSQRFPVTGAVIVTTPQDIALLDAKKGLVMFEKVNIPVLGIIENMSQHICSHCGHSEPIFGEHGAKEMSETYGVEILGELPLQLSVREQGDAGIPPVVADPDGVVSQLFMTMARRLAAKISQKARDKSSRLPPVVMEKS